MGDGDEGSAPDIRLSNARRKLDRAQFHIEELRADVRDAGHGEPFSIPLRKHLDEDTGVLYLSIGGDTTRPEKWGPLIGDALHNLRSALDNGWWQLTIKHLKRTPAEDEAPNVQFPILKPGGTFNAGSVAHWVGTDAAALAERLNVHDRDGGDGPNALFPLVELRRLSNEDKHRNLHVAAQVAEGVRIGLIYHGSGPQPTDAETPMSLPGATFHSFRASGPKEGDHVITIPPDCWIRKPDFDFDAFQAGFISIDGGTDVLWLLDALHKQVSSVVDAMQGLLEGRAVEITRTKSSKPVLPPPPNMEMFDLPSEPGPPIPADWQPPASAEKG